MPTEPAPALPEGFLWGTATSAHQIEGDNIHSDWWAFERARRLTSSGEAARFLSRWEEDLDHAAALGTNAFRFSLEWSRVEPRPGEEDAGAWSFYERLVAGCVARGLEPMVTLLHFTLPIWAARAGGWQRAETVAAFRRHAARVAERLVGPARRFATVNEPNVQVMGGYLAGVFPPGRLLRLREASEATANLLRAHAAGYAALHEAAARRGVSVSVGPVQHIVDWRPSRWDVGGAGRRLGAAFNHGFLRGIQTGEVEGWGRRVAVPEARGSADYLGINYYMGLPADLRSGLTFAGLLRPPLRIAVSDLGWPIRPEGLTRALEEVWRAYRLPLYVTENGLADAADAQRGDFLVGHVQAIREAVRRGVDVRGYYHWSLLDNFEWHQGFGPRFGLVEVDYSSQSRRVRESGEVYRGLIARRGLAPGETGV